MGVIHVLYPYSDQNFGVFPLE